MNDILLRACQRQPVPYTPVWLMRQAGRYMAEYMRVRRENSFIRMCKTPDLATEITLQPVNRFGVDAAILFADILLPLEGMGIDFAFSEGEGPVIQHPLRSRRDVEMIRVVEPEEGTPYVLETIRQVRRELEGRVPLIGFSAAPFTLASYLIEGGGSKNYLECKKMICAAPLLWHRLMEKVTDVLCRYLRGQVESGAQVVQIFDSWVGTLNQEDYRQHVLPYSKKLIESIQPFHVPVIHFANNGAALLELIREAGGDVIGVDWRLNLDEAWERLGSNVAIQGNLDPAVLFAPTAVIEEKVKVILRQANKRPGHIFNLGHGIHQQTPEDHVQALVEAVHRFSQRQFGEGR